MSAHEDPSDSARAWIELWSQELLIVMTRQSRVVAEAFSWLNGPARAPTVSRTISATSVPHTIKDDKKRRTYHFA